MPTDEFFPAMTRRRSAVSRRGIAALLAGLALIVGLAPIRPVVGQDPAETPDEPAAERVTIGTEAWPGDAVLFVAEESSATIPLELQRQGDGDE